MKNILFKLMLGIMALSIFQACEINDPEELGIIYDGTSFVSFYGGSQASLTEKIISPTDTAEGMTQIIVRSLGKDAVTVNFDFDTTDIKLKAIEGVDFTVLNTSKTLSFPAGGGEDTIILQAIDNPVFDGGTRTVNIKLTSKSLDSYEWGTETTCLLSVMDDDHPLSFILGDYTVTYTSFGETGSGYTGPYALTISPVDGDVTKVQMDRIWLQAAPPAPIVMSIDKDNMTASLPTEQVVYKTDDYNILMNAIDSEGNESEAGSIEGTVNADGTITLNGLVAIDPDQGWFGKYATAVFVKQ